MPYSPQSGSDVVLLFDDTYTVQSGSDTVLLFDADEDADDYLFTYFLVI